MKRLEQVSNRMRELLVQLEDHGPAAAARRTGPTSTRRLKDLMVMTLETPESAPAPGRG